MAHFIRLVSHTCIPSSQGVTIRSKVRPMLYRLEAVKTSLKVSLYIHGEKEGLYLGHEKTDFQNHIYLSYSYEIKLVVLTSSVEDVTLDNHFISEHGLYTFLS